MTTHRIRIGEVTHDRGYWGKDEEGRIRSKTRCGILYAYRGQEHSASTPIGEGVKHQDIDCMTCLVAETRR